MNSHLPSEAVTRAHPFDPKMLQALFDDPMRIAQLREAFRAERKRRPFYIDAVANLPDHLHAAWTLPPGDADYSIRWRNIKSALTHQIETEHRPAVSYRRQYKKEQAIWQPRFWEHRIRDEGDYARHVDYTPQPGQIGVCESPGGLAIQQYPPVYPARHFARGGGCGPMEFPDDIGHE